MPLNPHANFSPVLEGYTGQDKFRFWCQMALPLTYDDSLSYYELLCKVVTYLNNTIEDVSDVETNVTNLATAYDQLQSYVNNYFDNLDIEAELRNVLDAMAEDGTLDDLLDPLVQDHLPSVVDEQIDDVVADQIDDAVAGQIDDVVAEQLPPLVEEGIPGEVSDWLTENVDPVGSAVVVDSSLTISGAAADAKVTGDEVADLKTQLNDSENGFIHISPSLLTQGELKSDGTIDTTKKYLVASADLQFDRPIKISVKEGYQYSYAPKTGESEYSIGSWITYPTFVPADRAFRLKIWTTTPSWSPANLNVFALQININSESSYDIYNNASEITKLKKGRELLNAVFVRGTIVSGAITTAQYRVATRDIVRYAKDINIKSANGFRFGLQYFNANDEYISDKGWQTNYTIPADQGFKIVIARTTEDTSEKADVFDFVTKVDINTDFLDYVNEQWENIRDLPILSNGRAKLLAHMGYKANYPENTIEAFEEAGKLGYWCIESDVQQTSDGHYIMMHDTTLDRTTNGTGNIIDHTLAEIEQLHIKDHPDMKIPTLEEYLAICKWYGCVPNIEIKSSVPNSEIGYKGVIDAALACGYTEKNIIFSGSKWSISNFRKANANILFFAIYQSGVSYVFADELAICKNHKNVGMSWDILLGLTKAQVQSAHENNVLIGTYQITSSANMLNAFALGVDWCCTDNMKPTD